MTIEEKFAERLVELRIAKGVSARDMSLSIGQSAGYINNIENKKICPQWLRFSTSVITLKYLRRSFLSLIAKIPKNLMNS